MRIKNVTKQYNLEKILRKEHEGKWVAVTPDYKKIVAYSNDLLSLKKDVKNTDVVFLKAFSSDTKYAFSF